MAFFKEMYKKIESRGSEKEVPPTEESKVLQSGNEAKENLEKPAEKEEFEEFKEKEPSEEAIPQEKPEEPLAEKEEKLLEENIELQVPAEKNHLDLGFEFLDKKEYEQAIKEFLQALKEEATNY